MRVLLDTHVFLWSIADSPSLKPAARRLIESAGEVYVSAASVWELAIKAGLGKIDVDAAALSRAIVDSGFIELPIRASHAAGVSRLPPLHRDPFDRLLVAQALAEPLKLLTADAVLTGYTDLVTLI